MLLCTIAHADYAKKLVAYCASPPIGVDWAGFTLGALNITSQNISTYCLFATGILQPAIDKFNLSLMPAQLCQQAAKDMNLNFTN